jgi:hypothetical protein
MIEIDQLRLAPDYLMLDCGCELGTVAEAFTLRPCSPACPWFAYFTGTATELGKPLRYRIEGER